MRMPTHCGMRAPFHSHISGGASLRMMPNSGPQLSWRRQSKQNDHRFHCPLKKHWDTCAIRHNKTSIYSAPWCSCCQYEKTSPCTHDFGPQTQHLSGAYSALMIYQLIDWMKFLWLNWHHFFLDLGACKLLLSLPIQFCKIRLNIVGVSPMVCNLCKILKPSSHKYKLMVIMNSNVSKIIFTCARFET